MTMKDIGVARRAQLRPAIIAADLVTTLNP